MAFSPLANGLPTDRYTADTTFDSATDYRVSMPQFRRESFVRNRSLFSLVEGLAQEYRATPSQISLAWMLNKKLWIVPIPGARHSDRLREKICAAEIRLTPEQVKSIDAALDAMRMSEVFGGPPAVRPSFVFFRPAPVGNQGKDAPFRRLPPEGADLPFRRPEKKDPPAEFSLRFI